MDSAPAGNPVNLRPFRDRDDFEIVARIRNKWVRAHQGADAAQLGAETIESLVSNPERLRIADVGGEPAGFVFVARPGSPQLDEFGTIEGKSWLMIGPTCVPDHEGTGIESRLVEWLIDDARQAGIGRVLSFSKDIDSHAAKNGALAAAGFGEALRYYFMERSLASRPQSPRALPGEFELVAFGGEEDFDRLWRVLEPAFDTIERDAGSYEREKALFSSLGTAYFPICLDSTTGQPVGSISLMQSGDHAQVATLGVIPAYQRRGIGSLLMERALDRAWNLGAQTVDLSVRVENPQALGLYRGFGFEVVPARTTVVHLRDV